MPHLQIPEPLTVISPHLDDAVFSCGALLAAARDAVVVTVLAGVPEAPIDVPDWDRAAGFGSATQAVLQRRREDTLALGLLGARPEWLDFLDGQYGKRHEAAEIIAGLAAAPSMRRGGTVVAPMGLFHGDHILVSKACMLLHAADTAEDGTPVSPAQWLFYEDAIYRQLPGMVQRRLMGWWQAGQIAAPVQFLPVAWQGIKMAAVEAYKSQLPLFNADQFADIGAPERYWSLDGLASIAR